MKVSELDTLLTYASQVYAFHYFGIIILVALLEAVAPWRRSTVAPGSRWLTNFGITVIDSIVVRFLFPVAGFGWAAYCAQHDWGVFNQISVSRWVTFPLSILVLDLTTFGQHMLLHHFPFLWRIHRTHHSDVECDFSTAARFHPLETLYTITWLSVAIAVLGLPPVAVFVSQLLSTVITFAEHGNVRYPTGLERVVRLMIVTPDLHRIHHSDDVADTNSNYGTVFPWWDRVMGTYAAQSRGESVDPTFGLAEFREPEHQTLIGLLAQPFHRSN